MARRLKARDIMREGAQCIGAGQTVAEAARMMRDLDVGCLPVCGEDDRLEGMITDRDIVVKCCAEGMDLDRVRAHDMAGELHWIDAEAEVGEVLDTMERHRIKRLPVIDVRADHRLVGIISESDLVRNVTDEQIAEFVGKVYTPH